MTQEGSAEVMERQADLVAHVKKGAAAQFINPLLVSLHSLEERKPGVDAGVTAAFWGMINYQPKLLRA